MYYYKTDSLWVFEDGTELPIYEGAKYHLDMRKQGIEMWRLFLDLPEDYAKITRCFKTPSYWKRTTWQKEQER